MAWGQPSWGSVGASRARRRLPSSPARPPAGTYDPALDAQLRAAQRGFQDLRLDTETANQRANTAYSGSLADINEADRQQSTDFQRDIWNTDRSYSRGLADILKTRSRAREDYGTNIADMNRNYQRQANVQAEQATAAGQGGGGGGTLKAAMKARGENLAIDNDRIGTGYFRFQQDSAQDEARNREDFALANQDINENQRRAGARFAKGRADAAQGYQYGVDDRAIQLARGGRELDFYGEDVGAQRFYQATSSGLYNPPEQKKPKAKKKR